MQNGTIATRFVVMPRLLTALVARAAPNALRLGGIVLGFWLAALLPVNAWVVQQRADKTRAGTLADMDPGTVLSLAVLFALALLVVVLLIEVVRCWVLERAPLALPACVALGACASWPVGWYFAVRHFPCGPAGVFIFSALSVVAFHALRSRWFARRKR